MDTHCLQRQKRVCSFMSKPQSPHPFECMVHGAQANVWDPLWT